MATTATTQFPGLTLEIAPGTGMKTAASSWTDITVDLRGFNINRGRERELDQFQAGTATFTLNNRGRKYDPEYSAGPFFGNLVPMMQIRLRSTYAAVTSPLFYGYIEAYPQSYPGYDADGLVELPAVDGFAVLALAQNPDSVWDIEAASVVAGFAGSAWYSLGERYGETMGDRSGNGRHGTYNAPVISNQQGLMPYSGTGQALKFDGVDDRGAAPAETALSMPYSVAFWVRMPDEITLGSPHLTILRQNFPGLSDSRSFLIFIEPTAGKLVFQNDEAGIVHFLNPLYSTNPMVGGRVYFVAGTYATGGDQHFYINGVEQTDDGSAYGPTADSVKGQLLIGASNGATFAAWPDIIDEVLYLAGELTPTQVADLYEAGATPWTGDTSGGRFTRILDAIGWPASLRDLDAGESLLGPATLGGKALDYLQLVAQTEAGLFYMTADGKVRLVGRAELLTEAAFTTSGATFGDGAGEMDYHDVTVDPMNIQQVNNIGRVSRQGGIDQEYEDTTSSTKYGPRDINRSGLLMATDGEAAGLAKSLVLLRKDPQFRVDSLTITPGRDPANLFPKVLAYELGQKVTVTRRPQGLGSAITKEVRIEGIRHEVDAASRLWTTTYATSPVDPNEDNWAIVGSGLVGTHLVSY